MKDSERERKMVNIMTTINVSNNTAKLTRAEAINWVLTNVDEMPVEVRGVLEKIYSSFTKKIAKEGPTKTELANRELAVAVTEYVNKNFNEDDPMALTAKVISDNVPGIATSQKAVAVVKYANIQRIKNNGKTAYAPIDVEIVEA